MESDQHGPAIAHASRKQHHVISSVKDVLDDAAIHLQLAYKRNTLLPYFFGIGMISMATKKQQNEMKQIGELIISIRCTTLYVDTFCHINLR